MLSNASGAVRAHRLTLFLKGVGGEKTQESLNRIAIALFWGQGGGRVAPESLKMN